MIRGLLTLIATACCLAGSPLAAGPYDDFISRPGDIITNTAVVEYVHNGNPMDPLEATTRFTVQHFPPEGTITAYERYRGVGAPEDLFLSTGFWSPSGLTTGPFVELPPPNDTSELTGGESYTVPGSLEVRATNTVRQGVPIVFAIDDPTLNIRGDTIDTVPVTLTDSVTGDTEVILFTETGPNTGIFVGWINTTGAPGPSNNGILRTAQDSEIEAVYRDPSNVNLILSVTVQVEPPSPQGRVFDSSNGQLLNGIPFTLVDATTGAPATVRSADLRATLPASFQTGAAVTDSLGRTITPTQGGFVFPYLEPGSYRLVLGEIATHTGPTVRTDAELALVDGGPWRIVPGSRLDDFTVGADNATALDIPLDRVLGRPDVVRTGSIDNGAIGDPFEYTVEITPPSAGPITFRDELPQGIRFIPGTFLIDGEPWTPEVSADGRTLVFRDVPVRGAGFPLTLTYGARIATDGDHRSWTRVLADGSYSLSDDHDLRIVDVFGLEEIAIMGEILAGPCGEPHQDRNLEGIRVYLENGEYALTDSKGLFTFRGVARHPRVVQVDTNTLPPGASMVLCQSNTRAAGSPISRFVDVAPGQIGRVDFRIVFDEEVVAANEATRAGIEQAVDRTTPFDVYTDEWFLDQGPRSSTVLAPTDGAFPLSEALEIVFVRGANERVRILANGDDAEPSVRQTPTTSPDGRFVLERWSGLRIRDGRTTLTFVFEDNLSGAELRRETRSVAFATSPGRITLLAEGTALQGDGTSLPIARLRVTDRDGTPIRPGTRAQFSIERPFAFMSRPPRDSAPGETRRATQTIDVEIGPDGVVELELAPIRTPGKVRIGLATDRGPITVDVPVQMDARPWILVGIAEGTLASDTVRANMRPLTSDRNPYAGRIAFFAEGVVAGKWLLTLRYDSEQERDSFYGIDPDKDYIVYGDRSIQGNDAQGRFPLYIRLRSDEAEYLLGDFQLDFDSMLVQEQRKATGLRALYETETFRAMAFVAETDQATARDRIALNGTVGPYTLTQGNIVPNSESVRLVTVSRLDATRELADEGLEPGVDYVLDHATGRLWLRRPIAAFTPTLDRRVLVIDYETDEGTTTTRMAGVRVEGDINPDLHVGATVLHSDRVDGQNVEVNLVGLDVSYSIGPDTTLKAEVVGVRKEYVDGTEENGAAEIRFEHRTDVTEIYARYRMQRGDIELTADRDTDTIDIAQVGISHRLSGPEDTPGEGVFVEGNAMWERNRDDDTERTTVEALRVTRDAQGVWGGGLSWSKDIDENGETSEALGALARAGWTSKDGKMRQDIELYGLLWSRGDVPVTSLTLGAEYDITEDIALFGRFDANESADRMDRGSTFSLGLKAKPWDDFEGIFALSRAQEGGEDGWGLYASATQEIAVGEHGRLSFGMDAQNDFGAWDIPAGADLGNPYIDEDFVAARVGYKVEKDTWAFGVDVEGRTADSDDTANIRVRADGEVGNNWSVGGEAFAGWTDTEGARERDMEIKFAAAQRRTGNAPITLFQAEIDRDEDTDPSTTVFLSAHHNRSVGEKGELGARYAVRHTRTELSSGTYDSTTHFGGLEYRHDISEKFDLGLQGSIMHDIGSGVTSESFGLSVGMTPFDNSWLSLGYNFKGFEDEYFEASGATQEGPFLQFRLKFDQNTVRSMFRGQP
jgi:hypothetical protein